MALGANVLAHGVSGVCAVVVERLMTLLNLDLQPRIPAKVRSVRRVPGSAAHLALGLIGEATSG